MKFVLYKKKIVLKTKTNLLFVNQKTSKGKKKWKEMKWTKVPVQLKKKNRIEKFKTQNLRKGNAALVLVEDKRTRRKAKRRCKSVDEDVIKFKSMKCKNREDRRRVWLRINKKK